MLGNFSYYNPTKLYFGDESLNFLKDELKNYGPVVLLNYGSGSVKRNGIYDQVIAHTLQLRGCSYPSVYFLQCSCLRIDDEAANHDVLRHQRMGNLVNHITKHIKIKGKITHFATNLLILQQLLKKFRKFGERPCS